MYFRARIHRFWSESDRHHLPNCSLIAHCIHPTRRLLTQVLQGIDRGEPKAADELLPLVYAELRRLAAHKMANEIPGQTLQPTALVHEAWLRLSQQSRSEWKNRDQFFAVAAEVMRRILVDRARRRRSQRRGGNLERVEMDSIDLPFDVTDELALQVDEALERLAFEDPEKAKIVKLRFFVGLGNAEIAALLGVSEKTVQRHWAFAKAWLTRAIQEPD
jgi:RNA polymerase sigma factor (TIGR02999 family)